MKPASCHPEKPAYARGLCRPCYTKALPKNSVPAKCHPERPHFARGLCNQCYARLPDRKAAESARHRVRYKANSEAIRARVNQKYREATPEEVVKRKAYQKRQRAMHGRRYDLHKSYRMTPEEYAVMFSKQNGCCAICGKTGSGRRGAVHLHVDHCHADGMVRGLLCHNCNFGLGHFKDDPARLVKAIEYLRRAAAEHEKGEPT